MFLNNLLQFLGFGWEVYYTINNANLPLNRTIRHKNCYRINKYTKQCQKRTMLPLSNGFDYNYWYDVSEVPNNLIEVKLWQRQKQ